jgi:hypothetical protein
MGRVVLACLSARSFVSMACSRFSAALMAASAVFGAAEAIAQANPVVTVKVTILKIDDDGDDNDTLSGSDFYVSGTFTPSGSPGIPFDTEAIRIEGEKTIHPNWVFEFSAPPAASNGSLVLRVHDYDSGLNFGDDTTVDATFNVDFGTCVISGAGITSACGWDITVDQDDTVVFRVEVLFPPSSPGLFVRCLQDPLVPMPGQAVTINMETLDNNMSMKIATEHVIMINNTMAQRTTAVGSSTFSFTPSGSTFFLRCWSKNTVGGNPDAEVADTWTRQVRVGTQPERQIPVAYVGPPARSIDLVIIPDRDAVMPLPPSLADDPVLQAAIRGMLWAGVYNTPYILANQNRFNLWIARTTGDTDGTMASCDSLVAPEDWDQYAFADAGWIFHTDQHRDCADPALRIFGADPGQPFTPVHEMGHTPFGLADEYCCDGGYGQAEFLPNVYRDLQSCTADLLNAGAQPGDCRRIGTTPWYTSDPLPDVMADDRRTFNRLDRRRANWLLDRCVNSLSGC